MAGRHDILCVVGARPNFMKIAPIMRALRAHPVFSGAQLVHTGQHYDDSMKACFFEQLDIPEPDVDLEVGSASHAVQTAEIMRRFEPVLEERRPSAVLVVGDVNSTIACGLVSVKLGYPLIHVEAGLRSYDRSMPEEINRVLTDQISDLLFTTERAAESNLVREGIDRQRIHFVGNVMIDTLLYNLHKAQEAFIRYYQHDPDLAAVVEEGYGLVTLHRPSNVDDETILRALVDTLVQASRQLPLFFPVHPRTRANLHRYGLEGRLLSGRIHVLEPLGYLEMIGMMAQARIVLTDSGGIQEETTALGIPCLTLRENTERPITVTEGTNTVVGVDPERIMSTFQEVMENGGKQGRIPELWDGQAAKRIADVLERWVKEVRS